MPASPSTYSVESLPYSADSSPLMRRLSSMSMPAFLDSNSHIQGTARYDILSASPVAYVLKEQGVCSCSDPDIKLSNEELFSVIKQLRDKYLLEYQHCIAPVAGLPFQGGLIGYLGYPRLQGRAGMDIADAFFAVYLWAVVVDHHARSSHLVFHPACSVEQQGLVREMIYGEAAVAAVAEAPSFSLRSNFANQLSRDDYGIAFRRVKEYILAGDCYQVNLTQQFLAECQGEPFAAYLRLRIENSTPYSAYLNWGSGALLSLSPERFLQKRGKQVTTEPIKGTRPRGRTESEDAELARQLLASEKDQAENLMIVDLLRNDLGRVCEIGSIEVNQLFQLQSFSNVHHLVSTVSGTLRQDKDAIDLLADCFPGGSITGAPKLRAMEIIEGLERTPRRAYCGSVFYLAADGRLDSNITIRTLLWQQGQQGQQGQQSQDRIFCWAGGGIVADSECDEEYRECFDKINSIISTLED